MEELVFKYVEVRPEVEHAIQAVRRGRDGVQVLIRDGMNRWVLATKAHVYPEGVAKMVGGGIVAGEDPAQAMVREIFEETGAKIEAERLVPLIHAEVTTMVDGVEQSFSSFVFYCPIHRALEAGSDVTDFLFLSEHEIHRMIARMSELPALEIVTDAPATWSDWGRVWAPIHEEALTRVKELGL